jgi:hemoglobin-like flavoprotein
MTPEDVDLVQTTFERVRPIAAVAADMFYGRLFEIAPEVRPLFKGDMAEQGRKLMATPAAVAGSLHSLSTILPAVSTLAKKHVEYGVKPDHYASVGAALLWTLERGLGASWTPETAAAWTSAYVTLSDFMIREAYGRKAAAAVG